MKLLFDKKGVLFLSLMSWHVSPVYPWKISNDIGFYW